MTVVADTTPGAQVPAGQSVADRVMAQLKGDYPPGALSWVDALKWSGPVQVPLAQIDRKAGDWSAADDTRKVEAFRKRIAAGWRKPVVAIRRPGTPLLYLTDGHTRASACAALGQPVTAYVGTSAAAHGGWESTHHKQLANDGDALEMSAQTGTLSTVHHPLGKPGGPGLFRVKNLQLPAYIQNIAAAMERNGHTESQAIQLAIGACQRWARGGGKVSPEVRAAAAKALSEWEAAKARAHEHSNHTEAVELAGAFNGALHPRVGAGATGGGRFAPKNTGTTAAAGQQQPPPKGAAKPKGKVTGKPARPGKPGAGPHTPPPAGRAGKVKQLRSQAAGDRARALAIREQIAGLRVQAHAIAAKQKAAKAASAKAAKAAASGTKAATKTAAKASTKTAKKKTSAAKKRSTTATRAAQLTSIRSRIASLRVQARSLDARAGKLDAAAGKLK